MAYPIDRNKEQIRPGTWSAIRKAQKQKLIIYFNYHT